MAIDPNIPLQTRSVDVLNPLLLAAQREQQEAQQNRLLQQDARQRRLDAESMADRRQQRRLTGLQIDAAEREASAPSPEDLAALALDTAALWELHQAGDFETAAIHAQDMRERGASLGIPTGPMDRYVSLLGESPEQAGKILKAGVDRMRPMMPELFRAVRDPQGNVVAQENVQTGQVSSVPEAMRPPNEAEAEIQRLQLENQRLQNERLQGQTRAQEQEAVQAQQAQENQQAIRNNELARAFAITEGLLQPERRGAVEGTVGPLQGRLPSFRTKSADVEADLKELQDLLTLDNLDRMSGVLSETDIKLLANAASGIDLTASEERMFAKLQEIQGRIADAARRSGVNLTPQQNGGSGEGRSAEAGGVRFLGFE